MTCMHGELLLRFICGKDNTDEEHVFECWVICCVLVFVSASYFHELNVYWKWDQGTEETGSAIAGTREWRTVRN